ncbi:MAG: sigma-54 dependent transcriptional regulator [Deltaproteobacteria bacterium]|jgi:DNA-binding NtrC family response regulator|nr:sigma-54 dependent transcriptional regulator [Deltaproteobacteria bacterium]
MAVFLSIDLSQDLLEGLASFAGENSHELLRADSWQEARTALGFYTCDLVFFPLESDNKGLWPMMPPLAQLPGQPAIIAVVRGQDAEAGAFAIQSGCWDVLNMPCEAPTLSSTIKSCLTDRKILETQSSSSLKRENILGGSPALQRLLQQIGAIASSDSSVLILGETGTGKELFAKAIHANSPRAGKPMIVVDCTNLPATLAESLLFGHARGSFTGAVESSEGLFKQADGGTIFLDEIGELDINVQKSLLRVIQERRFRPLSAKKEISCDFRLIAATNQDLEAMVHAGRFRQDLYHRINTQTITLPPLRDRVEDIPVLFRHYVDIFTENQRLSAKGIAPETMEALKKYPWPGNVREMVNVADSAVLKSHSLNRIYPQHLPGDIRLFLIRANITAQDLLKTAQESSSEAELPSPEAEFSGFSGLTSSMRSASLFASSGESGEQPEADNHSMFSGHSYTDTIFIRPEREGNLRGPQEPDFAPTSELPSFKQARAEFVSKLEACYLVELIRRCKGDFARAREISGLSRARLYELLKQNNLAL